MAQVNIPHQRSKLHFFHHKPSGFAIVRELLYHAKRVDQKQTRIINNQKDTIYGKKRERIETSNSNTRFDFFRCLLMTDFRRRRAFSIAVAAAAGMK
jgi:hypothetical protein